MKDTHHTETKCTACYGTGELMVPSCDGPDYDGDMLPCHFCNGAGVITTEEFFMRCHCGGELIHRSEAWTDYDGTGPFQEEWRECVECGATRDVEAPAVAPARFLQEVA